MVKYFFGASDTGSQELTRSIVELFLGCKIVRVVEIMDQPGLLRLPLQQLSSSLI
jgi:hypothetical protein